MSTSQADLEKEFQQHNWNEDKEWQNIVSNMDFPPNYDEPKKEEFLLKRKRKYYREKVVSGFFSIISVSFLSQTCVEAY
ncbi:hypothetical protein RFI_01636 [Reticulomyxa filosa]|uniref:Uncharacterized protein n=1 Tax=Reticulomyxa filosa TaxID=46433 RepID=X6PA78_RETFI|nr:hypothetical protein RFI_01636 [Reticulomyxa filosa]|eukprot:ETO35425.1 hypothetical protein RFI_01636 [Reticulomyxa filosa]